MRGLVHRGRVKIPEGVRRELKQKTDQMAKTIEQWGKKYSLVVNLDNKALQLLRNIERKYGPQFNIGGKNYPGFWASSSGRKSVDAQVLALAKSRGWIVI